MDQFCTDTIHSPSLHSTSEHVKHTGLMVHLKSQASNMVHQSCSAVTIGIAVPQLGFFHSITNSPLLHTISPEPTEWFISGNQPQLLLCGCRMFTQAFLTALQIIRLQLLPILHKQPQLHTYCEMCYIVNEYTKHQIT